LPICSPEKGLAPPPGDPLRGPYYRWMFFAAGPVEASVTGKALGLLAPEDKAAMAGYGTFDATMMALEKAVSQGDYICGDQFTAADVYVGSQIGWGLMFGTIDKRPASPNMWEDCRAAQPPSGPATGRRGHAQARGAVRVRDDLRSMAIALYDRFTHEGMDRRAFMAELTRIAGGAAAANALLLAIAADPAAAALVPKATRDFRRARSNGSSFRVGR
jgi:hypothetical protein